MKAKKITKITQKNQIKQKTEEKSKKSTAKSNPKITEKTTKHSKKTPLNTQPEEIKINKTVLPKSKDSFNVSNYIVYPSHGVGKITSIDNLTILNQEHKLYIIYFEKEKLTIKIPVEKAEKYGIRHLVSKKEIEEVLTILRGGVKKIKGMWSRRAQEYEEKINSGNIMLLAEVIRDLTRDIQDGDRSFSERLIYETAIFRLANEYAIIFNISLDVAKEKVVAIAKDKVTIEPKGKDFDLDFDNMVKSLHEEDEEEDEDEEEEDDDEEHYKSLDKYSQEDDEDDFMEQFKKAEKNIKKDKKSTNKTAKKSKK
jgi:CarD family transcriptional regulator